MQFIYPLFLTALAALAIPIIIHLFYFRRYKKVLFTNVRFLKEVKEESSIRSRLKNLLTLLCRLLAVLFLVLGFAQPFINKDDEIKKGRKSISLFIDNSFSMASLSQDAPLLDEAKQKATEIIRAYDHEDQFQIISHDMTARQQRMVGRDQAIALTEEIDLTPEVIPLSKIILRQKQLLDDTDNPNKILYYLTDFQKNITDLDLSDTSYYYNLIPMQAVIEQNVSIDSAWFEAPVQMLNKPNMLLVKVKNWSDQKVENVQLSMRMEGQVKPVGSLDIEAGSHFIDTVFINVMQPGIKQVELKITDFPIQFDDTYYLSFEVKQQIETLVINQDVPNKYIDAALGSETFFTNSSRNISNLDYSSFNRYQLILLNELYSISSGLSAALRNYLEEGGNVVVFPAKNTILDDYNLFLLSLKAPQLTSFDTATRVVNFYNSDEFIFRDVFEQTRGNLRLPTTAGNFKITNVRGRSETLLRYRDGDIYMVKFPSGDGHIYLCSSPLDLAYNNLVTQAEVFIPMLYKMALSTSRNRQIAYTIGEDQFVEMENESSSAEMIYRVTGPSTFIPSQQSRGKKMILGLHDQIREAGFYDVYLSEDHILNTFAFNSNRLESDPSCFSEAELRTEYSENASIIERTNQANLNQYIREKDQGILLWKHCLTLALIFLALETLIIRFWSVR